MGIWRVCQVKDAGLFCHVEEVLPLLEDTATMKGKLPSCRTQLSQIEHQS